MIRIFLGLANMTSSSLLLVADHAYYPEIGQLIELGLSYISNISQVFRHYSYSG